MKKHTKLGKAYFQLQAIFGSEVGFKYARLARGCITAGQYFKRGDPHVEVDQKTWESLVSQKLVKESSQPVTFYISG